MLDLNFNLNAKKGVASFSPCKMEPDNFISFEFVPALREWGHWEWRAGASQGVSGQVGCHINTQRYNVRDEPK